MDIKEVLKTYTQKALEHYGDRATKEFYNFLRKKEFKTTYCVKCKRLFFPPRLFCPDCFSEEIEWRDMPKKGLLYAFTQQERSLRFGKPDVIGIVELKGVGKILTRIAVPFDELNIGDELILDFVEVDGVVLHQFKKS